MTETLSFDIAVIGGGLGGVAAALAAAQARKRVLLTEATDWLGGQISSQGVSALDEHAWIETFGGTRLYNLLREQIRLQYMQTYGLPERIPESVLGPDMPLNPGNGWVSRLCFEPKVGLEVLHKMLAWQIAAGRINVWYQHHPVEAEMQAGQISTITLRGPDGVLQKAKAHIFIDATERGELLPLTHTPYVTGAEARSDTAERHALESARPQEMQGFTYSFVVEYCPGQNHTIPRPPGYEAFLASGTYTLSPIGRDGQPVRYNMFGQSDQGNLPFWTYRRIYDGSLMGGNDLALINWGSNDYHATSIIDVSDSAHEDGLTAAKQLSLGFLYWLQTACPRDDGGVGYPEFKLRPDVLGSADGLSKAPYIRESRRIKSLVRITEQDISADEQLGARARPFSDSMGLGWYAMDLHPCVGNPDVSMYAPTRPFQIPMGALIPQQTQNLLAGCKNIGTTHLSNGAYRLHPTEWNIGEAAGVLAAFCVQMKTTPAAVHADVQLRQRCQMRALKQGLPLAWAVDVPPGHECYLPTQWLLLQDVIRPGGARWQRLDIAVDEALADDCDMQVLAELLPGAEITAQHTWRDLCEMVHKTLLSADRESVGSDRK